MRSQKHSRCSSVLSAGRYIFRQRQNCGRYLPLQRFPKLPFVRHGPHRWKYRPHRILPRLSIFPISQKGPVLSLHQHHAGLFFAPCATCRGCNPENFVRPLSPVPDEISGADVHERPALWGRQPTIQYATCQGCNPKNFVRSLRKSPARTCVNGLLCGGDSPPPNARTARGATPLFVQSGTVGDAATAKTLP